MGAFKTIIGCNLDQYVTGSFKPTRYLILDTQEEKTINSTSTLAQQPLQNGDTMSDHMYRNPTTFNISGTFAINGKNWDDDSYNFMEKGDRLTNIQEVFEYIKDQGILCRLTTIDEDEVTKKANEGYTLRGNAKTRFKTRNNMALDSITWVEKQNSVKFVFKFSEVIMVENEDYEELSDEKRAALGLPYVTSPQGSSLGTMLANTGRLQQTIIRALYDEGYIENDFLRGLAETANVIKNVVIAYAIISVGLAVAVITAVPAIIAVSAAAGSGAAAVIGALAGSVSAVFPVGTIIVAAAAVIAGIAIAIVNIVSYHKKKEKQRKAFKAVKFEEDRDRLINLLEDVEKEVNKTKTGLTIYNITGNHPQVVTINIGGEYYLINFTKNNTIEDSDWSAEVTDMEGEALDTVKHAWSPVSSFCDLDRNKNLWFKDKSKEYDVYLVNPSLSEEVSKNNEELKNVKDNLEGYTIWVSKGDVKKHIERVEKSIENAIEAEGFI